MNKIKTKIATSVVLAACAGAQLFAQSSSTTYYTKQDTITLALTLQGQASVSTSPSVANAGNYSMGPLYYKTATSKFTQANLLKAIAYVLHNRQAGFYSTQATLELVQGELGGFWNISDSLAQSYPDYTGFGNRLTGSFNDDGNALSNPYYPALEAVHFPDQVPGVDVPYGPDTTGMYDFYSTIYNSVDESVRTSIADGNNEFAGLDTGRHFLPAPWAAYDVDTETGTAFPGFTGEYPVGHMQPWGQVYVKDPGHKDTSGNPLCENVTFFFDFYVQECYDCFYLSSFNSDATFKWIPGSQNGPPCCGSANTLTGKGTDRYYLSIDFDNTINNSFLNPDTYTNDINGAVEVHTVPDDVRYLYNYVGFTGIVPPAGADEGLAPDQLPYSDLIKSHLEGQDNPYEARFSLHGICTYNWTLKVLNPGVDIAADYIGTASYNANGYGFIGLICDLITGTATFTETLVKDVGCCDDENWNQVALNYTGTYGNGQGDYYTYVTGWFGPGWDGNEGYFNPDYTEQYNPEWYLNNVGGETWVNDIYDFELPDQNESPLNPAAALTEHDVDFGSSSVWENDYIENYINDRPL